MPLEILAEGFFGGLLRLIGWIFVDILFELAIRGLGYLILRPFTKVNVDSIACVFTGLAVWILVVFIFIFYF
ncbi:hypothetical protein C8D91_1560 [Marinicella litoralis]|uniref:Uncharacterized protein n=1 Tax=Marinicella litoralis TaxID=644220 RepID=A0A4R6XLY5_9GAMM|nr:hypothetical protein C8D91_1560 [Marinicella litoralis]